MVRTKIIVIGNDSMMSWVLPGIVEMFNMPSEITVDPADIQAIMKIPGRALMTVGEGQGKYGAMQAYQMAVTNPLVNLSIDGAKGVLFNVKGGADLTLGDVNAVGEAISKKVAPDAMIFFGMVMDKTIQEGRVDITIIATGILQEFEIVLPYAEAHQARH